MEMARKYGDVENNAIKQIFEWQKKEKFNIQWGKGKIDGSFQPILFIKNKPHHLFSVWTYGTVEILFERMKSEPPFKDEATRIELLDKLNSITGIELEKKKINVRPSIRFSVFNNQKTVDDFLSVWDWFIRKVKLFSEQEELNQ